MVWNSSQGTASQRGYRGPLTKCEVTGYAVEKASIHTETCDTVRCASWSRDSKERGVIPFS